MNLFIDSLSASFSYASDSFESLIDRLERVGYEPLMRKAAQGFCNVFGGSPDDLAISKLAEDEESEDLERECEFARRRLMNLEKMGYDWGFDQYRGTAKSPDIKSEVFFTEDGTGLLFVTVVQVKHTGDDIRHMAQMVSHIRIGYIGDPAEARNLNEFAEAVTGGMEEQGIDLNWAHDDILNEEFETLAKPHNDNRFQLASNISEKDQRGAKALENVHIRDVGQIVRRSGVILAKELLKLKAEQASELIKYVDQLLQADLVHQEYVVICSKTNAHVNRVESRETIEQMGALGVLCSCGKNIAQEPIEGLLAADPSLQRMLDSNYWMTATVVRLLNGLGIGSDRILLHVPDESDNVEFIVDVDGSIVLFDMKDSEFGLTQAYSLGARIALQRPKLAFIVSSRGITQEVKDHFKRVKPETQIVYVANMLQLEATVRKVVDSMRVNRAKAWLLSFQSMMTTFPLSTVLLPKLQNERFEIPHVVTSVQLQPEDQTVPLR